MDRGPWEVNKTLIWSASTYQKKSSCDTEILIYKVSLTKLMKQNDLTKKQVK